MPSEGASLFAPEALESKPVCYAHVSLPVGIIPPRDFEYIVPPSLSDSLAKGSLVQVPFRSRKLWGIVTQVETTPLFTGPHQKILHYAAWPAALKNHILPLIEFLSSYYLASPAQALRVALPWRLYLQQKIQSGSLKPDGCLQGCGKRPIELTPNQQEAWRFLVNNHAAERKPAYLWGPTGSGKTYVLLEYMAHLMKQGQSIIYLVPEITLTPQFAQLFIRELPAAATIALWSSKTPLTQKRRIVEGVLGGAINIILGTRSAVFLPLKNLGAIVLDEEQDDSFKQETPPPCYHAREIALWRAKQERLAVVLASATPSIESYHMMQEGKIARVVMKNRYGEAALPRITLKTLKNSHQLLNQDILDVMKRCLDNKGHILVFHNRRGFGRALQCSLCHKALLCGRCELPLILHNEPALLRCHHCGLRKKMPPACPNCGAPADKILARSPGTQKITQIIENTLGARTLRLDKDTTKFAETIYQKFHSGEAQILIGTKLVTKAWHFPQVTLVVVLDADTEFMLPDFRACERAFQTLLQAAGRAGRGTRPGEVLLQTRHPDHYVFANLNENSLETFYKKELELRRQVPLPPFCRLISLEIKSKIELMAAQAANTLAQILQEESSKQQGCFELIGPAPNYFHRLQGFWRHHIMLRWLKPDRDIAASPIWKAVAQAKNPKVMIKIRPDPHNLF